MRTRIHTLALLVLAALLISVSCTSESLSEGNTDDLNEQFAKSQKAKKATRAWRAKLSNAADLTMPLTGCIPEEFGIALTTNIISGNMTHMGKIQVGSFGRPQEGSCILNEDGTLSAIYHVNYIGAHGDMITTEEAVTIIPDYVADPNGLTGTFENSRDEFGNIIPIKILEGTGRFEGATGELFFMNATFVPAPDGLTTVSEWRLVGEITY